MPLHMTKIAYRAADVGELRQWLTANDHESRINTRYIPRRHEEMIGGSLYWILEHAIVGRSTIRAFEKREDGRWDIVLAPELVAVETLPRRAHQGWRYLKAEDAPLDLAEGADPGDILPGRLLGRLSKLGLV
jgi:hypothetical protein